MSKKEKTSPNRGRQSKRRSTRPKTAGEAAGASTPIEPTTLTAQAVRLSERRAERRRAEAAYWKNRPSTDTLLRAFCECVRGGEAKALRDHVTDEPLERLKSPGPGMSNAKYSELVRGMRGAQAQATAERRRGATQRGVEQCMQARFPGIPAGEIESVQCVAVGERGLAEWHGPGGVMVVTWAGREFLEKPHRDETPPKRSWTQQQVDDRIAEYARSIKRRLNKAERDVRAGKPGAIRAARNLFGRNHLADKQLCCPKAMVSKSLAWRSIAGRLGLRGNTPGVGRGDRVGLDIAVERKAETDHKRQGETAWLAGEQLVDGAAEKHGKPYFSD